MKKTNLESELRILSMLKKNNKKMNFENLTMAPIDRDLIIPGRLDNKEKKWINNYHKTVLKI